jgi:hypothetical protein
VKTLDLQRHSNYQTLDLQRPSNYQTLDLQQVMLLFCSDKNIFKLFKESDDECSFYNDYEQRFQPFKQYRQNELLSLT